MTATEYSAFARWHLTPIAVCRDSELALEAESRLDGRLISFVAHVFLEKRGSNYIRHKKRGMTTVLARTDRLARTDNCGPR